jgi:ABC-type glutathione transport system ATPase component
MGTKAFQGPTMANTDIVLGSASAWTSFHGHGSQRLHAVRNVSFEVRRGKSFGLVGGSGCGKSTVLRMLAGLDGQWSGRVTVAGDTRTPGTAPPRSLPAQGADGRSRIRLARCTRATPSTEP